ncbi:helix-turn-helix domain-containing protein [Myceligenerans indicum]|uniref:Helix-turn-helix domain-containing protein n=1 Tax=Myceligenerans indicum TaxID=2593663 RepID=A0ABS1LI66_9MICO|nr:helix-turn-helix transcriptional regulator [Myceligenerans indicum]MBL0885930.1 helix-turn-helix domain-containing protein [Myceligenerans indicum]
MPSPHQELGDFLRRARASSDPRRAGLPADGRVRRVAGLRREEVALLAGISADYYTRLEQGRRIVPSTQVIDAIARALDLDPAGRRYVHDLVGAAGRPRPSVRRAVQRVRPGLYQLLDALDGQPAMILGRRTDVLGANRLARALFTDFERLPARERNYARWMLLSDEARALFVDWEVQARHAVEALRLDAGRTPQDPGTQQLVGELSLASGEFREWWSDHQVHQRSHGVKKLCHPIVGELTVSFETLTLPTDSDQSLYIYTTAAGSASRQALGLLASWTNTPSGADARPRS